MVFYTYKFIPYPEVSVLKRLNEFRTNCVITVYIKLVGRIKCLLVRQPEAQMQYNLTFARRLLARKFGPYRKVH